MSQCHQCWILPPNNKKVKYLDITRDFVNWLNGCDLPQPRPLTWGYKNYPYFYEIAMLELPRLGKAKFYAHAIRDEIGRLLLKIFPDPPPDAWYVPKDKELAQYLLEESSMNLQGNGYALLVGTVNRHLREVRLELIGWPDNDSPEIELHILPTAHYHDFLHWPWLLLAQFVASKDFRRLQRCPHCKKMYLRTAKNQRFCSKDHQALWREANRRTYQGVNQNRQDVKNARNKAKGKKHQELLASPEGQALLKRGMSPEDVITTLQYASRRKQSKQ
ncbi:MAG: hypothetical protein KMY53_06155 [Desulfarculus sp.]|nr:hypothetical protein [Pseudomonadota bacterium]MBU4596368.1 hypothetical protein [Pseudomonadota bacterium]MBV1717080.1 hypothetical protein [Desulfarculus sp.]MBV1737727.1 hypothetical protein [Desulfarculus sp.]